MVRGRPGYTRFWSGNKTSFDEPFRSYAAEAFATPAVPGHEGQQHTAVAPSGG
jgi:hypothetical protein